MTTGQIILTIALAAGGYLLGAVPFALLVARGLYGVDIREIGTGNVGAGNAKHELGFGAGALVMARVARVVFGAWEPKTGAVGSLWDVVRDRRLTHRPEVRGGVLAEDCATLLDNFFARHRDLG